MRALSLIFALAAALPVAADTSSRKPSWRPFTWDSFGIGSWVKYEMKFDVGGIGGGLNGWVKFTLEELTRDKVTLSQEMEQNGMKTPATRNTRDRDKTVNPFLQGNAKETARALETLEVKGRKMLCQRVEYEVATGGVTLKYKVWQHPSIPTGLVKMTMEGDGGGMDYKMELNLDEYERKRK